MSKRDIKGKVQTVLGLFGSEQLGFTLRHEHVLSDFRVLMPRLASILGFAKIMKKTDVKKCINEIELYKHEDQILISHESLSTNVLEINGGKGITHISKTNVPLMKAKGLTEEQIQKITVSNPARAFAIK